MVELVKFYTIYSSRRLLASALGKQACISSKNPEWGEASQLSSMFIYQILHLQMEPDTQGNRRTVKDAFLLNILNGFNLE